MNSVVVCSQIRMQEGAAMIRACSESGLSVRKWLEENNVSRSRYFYWKRKLKDSCLDQLCPSFVEVPAPAAEAEPSFNKEDRASAAIRIGAVSVEVYESASAGFLENLLKAARHAE